MKTPIVQVENLTYRYDKRLAQLTLDNLSFSAFQGEWLSIIGHNGSGKSTLAQLLIGLLTPDTGTIHIKGHEMNEQTKWELRTDIGIVFQNPDNQFIGTSVQDDIAFGLENSNIPYQEMETRISEVIQQVNLESVRYHDPSRLSGGQKQRVAIAGVLALHPSVIVLDEAFVMLDPRSRQEILAMLHQLQVKEKLTIISITHDMNEAVYADRIIQLRAGKIAQQGTPKQVFFNNKDIQAPFSEQLRQELARRNITVPNEFMTENEMVNWLCKLRLTV